MSKQNAQVTPIVQRPGRRHDTSGSKSTAIPAYYKAGVVGCGLILLIVAVVGIAYLNVGTTARSAHALADVYQPALDHLLNIEHELHEAQLVFSSHFMIPGAASNDNYRMRFREHIARAEQQFAAFRNLVPDLPDPSGVQDQYLSLFESWKSLSQGALQGSETLTDVEYGQLAMQYAEMRAHLHTITDEQLGAEMMDVGSELVGQSATARNMLAATLAVALLLGGAVTLAGVRAIRDQHIEILAEKGEREQEAGRREFEHRLHRAFELVQTEPGALGIVQDALGETLEHQQYGEMLLADSSVAHLGRVVSIGGDADKLGCGVSEPHECPAIRRNAQMQFSSNDVFETCPYLRGRGDAACSAVCMPVSIMGRTTGVLHIVGPKDDTPDEGQWRSFTSIAAAAGDELGLIRAFATKNEQANTDTLTGLSNRRSLESKIAEISGRGEFSIAFIDIDHFKKLNDTHGHETGDRALRLFADTLRSSLRPNDLAARWGGEEFVVVLPGVSANLAVPVLERIRERLREALAPAALPAFTISSGVSDSNGAPTFQEVVAQADDALLSAKRGGRDRIELATPGSEPSWAPEEESIRHEPDSGDADELVISLTSAATPSNDIDAEDTANHAPLAQGGTSR